MADPVAVVLSQSQSRNPARRRLEETLVAAFLDDHRLHVVVVPHLYDLTADHPALIALQALRGDFVILSWLYPRAAHWILDRHAIRGEQREVIRDAGGDGPEQTPDGDSVSQPAADARAPRVTDRRPAPPRGIWHVDLRTPVDPHALIEQIRHTAAELARQAVVGGAAPPLAAKSVEPPWNDAQETPARRWYPVIDYSRCTNCMECIDFCLFGVYGLDHQEIILVEQPDNCRKGCPACSRVCPENAIMFPQHKTPAIAGDPSVGSHPKIDLSELFGNSPERDTATQERDDHLRMTPPERTHSEAPQRTKPLAPGTEPRDELDQLIDKLDESDL